MVKVRRIASPFIRRIRQWTDINSFRNSFLAHNYRDSKGNNVFLKEHDKELNIPNDFGDFLLLCGCIFCAKRILVTEFIKEYNELIPHLKIIKPPTTKKGMMDEQQAMSDLNELISQSESIKSKLS